MREVQHYGALLVRGAQSLRVLRDALAQLRDLAGLDFVFAPDFDPTLRDDLAGAATGAMQGAVVGGGIGLLLGLIAAAASDERDRRGSGARVRDAMAIGGTLGALGGALWGAARVDDGWRLSSVRDDDGNVIVRVESLA